MIAISAVISEVQSDINDTSMSRVNRAEYVDIANRVAMKIAQETEIYINRYTFIPNPSSNPQPKTYLVKLPYVNTGTPNIDLAPYRIIRVTRGTTTGPHECSEYSQQAVARTISGNSSFPINNTQLGAYEYATQFVDNANLLDNSIHLIFGQSFATDENVTIDFVSNRPWGNANLSQNVNPLTRWMPNATNPQALPDYLFDCFKEGILFHVCDRLYLHGDETFGSRSEVVRRRYENALKEARAYSKVLS